MDQSTPEHEAVALLSAYVDRLLPDYADELNKSANKRLAFLAFVFGGISGHSLEIGLTPEQAHAVAISLFCQSFGMAPMDAIRMAGYGIDATAGDSPWSYAAHEGLDEFFAWKADSDRYTVTRLRSVLDRAPADSDLP
jgi:hypothetical protein